MFEELNDDEWARIASLAVDEPAHPHRRGRPRVETRVVANAVFWILTTGERWSKLPARYPSGPTCRRRFDEWLADGTLIEMITILSESGRLFTYIPQPAATPAPRRASKLESPRLRGVFWSNPDSWREADACRYRAGDLPAESSRPLPNAHDARKSMRELEHEAPALNADTAYKRIDDYCGYAIHAMVQWVMRQMSLSYRASVEIIKDGRRVERSGLIGPRFADLESAESYALEWARGWIDRQASAVAAVVAAVTSTSTSTSGVAPLDGKEAVVRPLPVTLEELAAATARKLETCGATDWLLHPDGQGDAKPPEFAYHV